MNHKTKCDYAKMIAAELLPHQILENEMNEKLEHVAEILYEYFCQLEKSNPTEFDVSLNLSDKTERTA